MTLAELYRDLRKMGDGFNTYEVPLKMDGQDFDVELSVDEDEGGYFIKLTKK